MAAKGKKHTARVTANGRPGSRRDPVREGCPWTHRLLAVLAVLFVLAAAGQMVAGAVQAGYAAWRAAPALTALAAKSSQLSEIALKREVQRVYREGGLYVPMEDVILSPQAGDAVASPVSSRGVSGKILRVWISMPFRIPWAGTFVYMWPRSYPLR